MDWGRCRARIVLLAIAAWAASQSHTLGQDLVTTEPQLVPISASRSESYAYTEISDGGPAAQDGGLSDPETSPLASEPAGLWNAGGDNWLNSYVAPYLYKQPALQGFFFQYDHLVWSLTAPNVTEIGQPVPEDDKYELVFEDPVNPEKNIILVRMNDLDTDFVNGGVHSAERFDFGHMDGDRGWFSSILFGKAVRRITRNGVNFVPSDPNNLLNGFVDRNGDTFDDDVNANDVFGRDGRDLTTIALDGDGNPVQVLGQDRIPDTTWPTDYGDMVPFLVVFDELTARSVVDLSGAELNRIVRHSPGLEVFYGVRYVDFREYFSLSGTGSAIGPLSLSTAAKNQIVGPQFGFRYRQGAYKFILNIEGRFMPGYNHQTVTQQGAFATDNFGGANDPMALYPTTVSHALNDDRFSAAGELRAEAILPINRLVAFRMGYTGTVLGGISYASPKVVYQLPNFGVTTVDSNETVLANAFTVGIEINR